jgi:uncharacterized repeat protein (TIGR01451 family)
MFARRGGCFRVYFRENFIVMQKFISVYRTRQDYVRLFLILCLLTGGLFITSRQFAVAAKGSRSKDSQVSGGAENKSQPPIEVGARVASLWDILFAPRSRSLEIWQAGTADMIFDDKFSSTASAAAITVTNTADSGAGSLRDAIAAANAAATDDTISFNIPASDSGCANNVCTINLSSGQLTIANNGSLTINGTGANSLTISSNNTSRVFNIAAGNFNVTFFALMIANGKDQGGNGAAGNGGAIYNASSGTVTVANSTLSANSAVGSDVGQGTAGAGNGGGIYNAGAGSVVVTNSTLSDNSAIGGGKLFGSSSSPLSGGNGNGGAIYNAGAGSIIVTNSTLSANSATGGSGCAFGCGNPAPNGIGYGGGIANNSTGSVTLINSTFSANSSDNGGGFRNATTGTVNLRNTLIAGNSATATGPDVNGAFNSAGHNLIGKSDGSTGFTIGNNSDQVGTTAAPLNPQLTPLGDYGGTTTTYTLLINSSAINAGDNCVLTANGCGTNNPVLTTDQRGAGFLRLVSGTVDIGAFELQPPQATTTTITSDSPDPSGSGQTITVTYTVTATKGGTRTGNVTVSDNVNSCTGTVAAGRCTLALTTLGNRTLTATYSGDTNFAGSASAGEPHRVNPLTDLSITKTDGATSVQAGGTTTYTIIASNAGPINAPGAIVSDSLPAEISSATWTCVGAGGASCNATGAGSINETVNLPVGGAVTFTLRAVVSPAASTRLYNFAFVAPPSSLSDANNNDNSAADFDSVTTAAPLTLTVDTTSGDAALTACTSAPNDCSYGGAVTRANNSTGDDTINFDGSVFAAPQTINLNSGFVINPAGKLTINGPAAARVTISLANSPNQFRQEFTLNDVNANLEVNNLTLTGGHGTNGGSISSVGALRLINSTVSGNSADNGGGIYNGNGGTLLLNNSTISGNQSSNDGGGIYSSFGKLTLTNTTISGNSATNTGGGVVSNGNSFDDSNLFTLTNSTVRSNSAARGGGIANGSKVSVTDSTISGNSGGGIFNNLGVFTLINSTVSGNSATDTGGGFTQSGGTLSLTNSTISGNGGTPAGGLLILGGTVNALNTIIANSTIGTECHNSGTINIQNSLVEDGSCGVTAGANNNLTGDPDLGPLQNNGGATDTLALLSNSPAINAGSNNQPPAYDQRGAGYPRIIGGTVDIGAFEYVDTPLALTVDTTSGDAALTACTSAPNDCSYGGAVTRANNSLGNDTINFDPTVFASPQTININSGFVLAANGKLTINGPTAARVTISLANSPNQFRQEFTLNDVSANLEVNNLTLTGGHGTNGGSISSVGTLTLNNSTVSGNSADNGGGIYSTETLTLNNSIVSGNRSTLDGGGINLSGSSTLINSTVSGNTADGGGGGINTSGGTTILINSTLSDNAGQGAGGLLNQTGDVIIKNSIIANSIGGNSSNTGVDCFRYGGTVNVQNSLVEDGGCGVIAGTNNNLRGDPHLGPLQNNGGATDTLALLSDSPAINRGGNSLAVDAGNQPLTTDQRGAGYPRIIGGTVDLGAFEFQQKSPTTTNILTHSPSSSASSQTITVTFEVTPTAGGTPTGNVTVSDGVDSCTGTVATGRCTLALTTVGNRILAATYAGDDNFTGSISGAVPHAVNQPSANLSLTKTDGATSVQAGGATTYTITAANAGPSNVTGATVSDNLPAEISSATWICTGTGGATCTASGEGSINETINLPSGGTVIYTVSATATRTATGTLSNTATVTAPAGMPDPNSGNNSATDNDTITPSPPPLALAVDTTSDNASLSACTAAANDCSLRGAIARINNQQSDDTITFDATVFANLQTITLTNGELLVGNNGSLTVNGVAVNGINTVRISGNNASRIFRFDYAGTIELNNLILTGGNSDIGAALLSANTPITINNSTVTGNNSTNIGGGIFNVGGTMNINNSTISNNTAAIRGGGLDNDGFPSVMNITNSTISGNTAGGISGSGGGGGGGGGIGGGGIFASSTMTIRNSTITGNTANGDGSLNSPGNGGGVAMYSDEPVSLSNTIVASNFARNAPDYFNGLTSLGYNLIGNPNGAIISGDTTGNLLNVDARLLALASNGGVTQTHALLPDSPAINAGTSTNAPTLDQRGKARVGNVDIGAYEAGANLIVTNTLDTGAGSLRDAIAFANSTTSDESVTFAIPANDSGCANGVCTINVSSGQLTINNNGSLLINGTGANRLTLRNTAAASANSRVFLINGGAAATLAGMTVTGGNLNSSDSVPSCGGVCGGGIYNLGNLSLTNAAVPGNSMSSGGSTGKGVGIFSSGALTITGSTVSGNSGSSGSIGYYQGGGIDVEGATLTMTNSTVSGNSILGSLQSNGGGIYARNAILTITNSTITRNSTTTNDGGNNPDAINGGGISLKSSSLTAVNTIISGNSSSTNPDLNGSLTGGSANNFVGGNAMLAPLADNGGPTRTHALLPGSPAIDAGVNALATDQRGLSRPQDGDGAGGAQSDIGSFEVQAAFTCDSTPNAGEVLISEFRTRGPNGTLDEFVELYNNTDATFCVATSDASSGWSLVSSDGLVRATLPNATVIPARAHYLVVNSAGYSLSAAASADLSYTSDIPDNTGLALFRTALASNFTPANVLDAVGFPGNPAPYFETAPLAPVNAGAEEFSFSRQVNDLTARPQETNNNAADFTLVATTGNIGGTAVSLGAPGPENLSSPIGRARAQFPGSYVDPTQCQGCGENRVRNFSPASFGSVSFPTGTLSIRRTFTNITGVPITRLRFRVVDITTLNNTGGLTAPIADLRAITSSDTTATVMGSPVTVRGTTLDETSNQSTCAGCGGGGMNSTLSTGVINTGAPLANGDSITVQFMLGVKASGKFRFFVSIEAAP